ncbi:MAG: fumarylacetoacetate hydrolase family protein [Hungatella sp.]|nr:fumarylacetoacetate hydrolase family protein [Hungatella sp.]
MKILTYEVDSRKKLGIWNKEETWIYPIESFGMEYRKMQEVIESISDSEIHLLNHMAGKDPYEVRGAAPVEEVTILSPILKPKQDVICLGINYMDHAEESARYQQKTFGGERPYAVYFSKRVNHCVGYGEGIPSHADMVDSLDYEVELAVIIRKNAYCVSKEEARDYIFGYSVINDVSARNIQSRHSQWYFGKSLDGFFPMGPCIVTAEEIEYPPRLGIRSYVNGELRQNSTTELLIFDIDHVISELSQGMTLEAGTIIAMGTPAGAGMGFEPPRFLKIGDEVCCEIDGIGKIVNPII